MLFDKEERKWPQFEANKNENYGHLFSLCYYIYIGKHTINYAIIFVKRTVKCLDLCMIRRH